MVIFGAASEAFSQKNINRSIAESIERFRPVAEAAKAHGMRVRAAVSCALGCPIRGEVPIESVVDCVKTLRRPAATTSASPTPSASARRHAPRRCSRRRVRGLSAGADLRTISTTPTARPAPTCSPASNSASSTFDTSVAGLGGCPYAKGATGNVATEDVLYMLHGMGIETGIDLDLVCEAGPVHLAGAGPRAAFAREPGAGGEAGGVAG